MNRDQQKLLHDVQSAALAILQFVKGKRLEDYSEDIMLRSAVERQFEIAGEAFVRLRDLDSEFIEMIPDSRKAIAFRNLLIHGYAAIRDEVVWDTAVNHLPNLLAKVNELLEQD
jgi:uncharacterized protein with HEPN domain